MHYPYMLLYIIRQEYYSFATVVSEELIQGFLFFSFSFTKKSPSSSLPSDGLIHILTHYNFLNIKTEKCRKGEYLLAVSGHDLRPYWRMLLPFSYATVSGAVGSCSVLFAKSLYVKLDQKRSHSWENVVYCLSSIDSGYS